MGLNLAKTEDDIFPYLATASLRENTGLSNMEHAFHSVLIGSIFYSERR
jgi:hypothetical protein